LFGDIVDIEMRLNSLGEIAVECWMAIPIHFGNVELDAFVVMPNHVHGIIVIFDVGATHAVRATHASPLQQNTSSKIPNGPKQRSIGAIIGSYKSGVSKLISETSATQVQNVWQRNYYEHIIHDDAELGRIREYIINNPLQWLDDKENPINLRM
jgi:REP element-mobilizing transposase RayT